MSISTDEIFHRTWLGMVQPVEGLVVSIPALLDAQVAIRQAPEAQARLHEVAPRVAEDGPRRIVDLDRWFEHVLGVPPDLFDRGDALPTELSIYIPEGRQEIKPTLALRRLDDESDASTETADTSTPSSRAGRPYQLLVWDLPPGLPLDRPEILTGTWHYPAAAKFDRLLREVRVPIGVLTNREVVRLVYAPHGEATGSITFDVTAMGEVGGRPILDALVMLLGKDRLFTAAPERRLPAILADSRLRQANVTNELARQVLEALGTLLAGFEAAAERDGIDLLAVARAAVEAQGREADEAAAGELLYGGLLTVLLRLVFVLYAEDRGLLPVDHPLYAHGYSVLGLYDELRDDAGAFPDTMNRRFGAWGRLIALFRSIFLGVDVEAGVEPLQIPPRRGDLFDPERFPFLEGWLPGGGAPVDVDARAAVRVPSVDDGTIHVVLDRLLMLGGQRLSYKVLDVEQIGSVYERLMGYRAVRVAAAAVCTKPHGVWVTAQELLDVPRTQREKLLLELTGSAKSDVKKIVEDVASATTEAATLDALDRIAVTGTQRAPRFGLVLQPGDERRRTSAHYTPRSLSQPIVRRTLEPLILAMGGDPSSERLLNLKVCDPAMGSGAFLVEACRYLADQVVAAWTREDNIEKIASAREDVVHHARRLVAQRCLYGVDKNPFAVSLAKLSMWLVTLAKDEPFTFVDHALRCGDSLVGLSLDQIRAFHWSPPKGWRQMDLIEQEIAAAIEQAVDLRQQILALAGSLDPEDVRHKERLLWDAEDAIERIRVIGDLAVGAFFAAEKPGEREAERVRRLDAIRTWLSSGEPMPPELRALSSELRRRMPVFHWMAEFPEVFWAQRPDPLDSDQTNCVAWMDAFIGNPPFAGKNEITAAGGDNYLEWLQTLHDGSHGNADLCAHFFRRSDALLGAHGTIGLIASIAIAQGDTRISGLSHLVNAGLRIYDATPSMKWPTASVTVAVVHLARGCICSLNLQPKLAGKTVSAISSRLRVGVDTPDPVALGSNVRIGHQGTIVLGEGFVLSSQERDGLVAKDRRNADRIFPYVGGDEVNSNFDQSTDRYVIDFGALSLDEAGVWPDLLAIVREKVRSTRAAHSTAEWWHFERPRHDLYAVIRTMKRCIVMARDPAHFCFSFQPTDRIFNEKLYVFTLDSYEGLGILQSRVHVLWAVKQGRKHGGAATPSYSKKECFEKFPFPCASPRDSIPAVASTAERLHLLRTAIMLGRQQGLTTTYNELKDPTNVDPEISKLRALHVELDRAVLAAYGWSDIDVPPFTTPTSSAEQSALAAFEEEVIDRLFALNATRAHEERLFGAKITTNGKRSKPKTSNKKSSSKKSSSVNQQPALPLDTTPSKKVKRRSST